MKNKKQEKNKNKKKTKTKETFFCTLRASQKTISLLDIWQRKSRFCKIDAVQSLI